MIYQPTYFLLFLILPGLKRFKRFLEPFPLVHGVALNATCPLLLKAMLGVSKLPFFISAENII